MTRKPSRRSSIIEAGSGPSRVRIYTIRRKDGYSQFTLAWKEGGRRTTRSVSCAEEARIIAQQITVRLTNGLETGSEATRRDIELLLSPVTSQCTTSQSVLTSDPCAAGQAGMPGFPGAFRHDATRGQTFSHRHVDRPSEHAPECIDR